MYIKISNRCIMYLCPILIISSFSSTRDVTTLNHCYYFKIAISKSGNVASRLRKVFAMPTDYYAKAT